MTAQPRTRQEIFAEYVLPQTDVLYRVARTLTGQAADAEDLVQDTLLRAFSSLHTFDGQYPRAWLLTILRNAERSRHRRRRPQLLDDPDRALERLEDMHNGDGSPEELIVDRTFSAEVECAFTALPAKYQEVVAMVDVEGLSYTDAATALDLPVGTVMSRLHRARKRIRQHLARAGVTVSGALS